MFHHHMRWARRMAEDGVRGFGPCDPAAEDSGRRGRHDGGRYEAGRYGGGRSEGESRRDRGGRIFDHGDLRLVIMGLLAEMPRYGYDIIKVLEERIGGGYSPSPGVVYPTLTLLEEMGHASVAEERGGRKLYTLTPEGLAVLEAQRGALNAILDRIAESAPTRRGPPPQVERAFENLRHAVRLRLRARTANEEQIRALAAALDAAARTIEEI